MRNDDNDKVLETGTELLDKLEDHSAIQERVREVTLVDPFMQLRVDLLEFFRNRISEIQKHDDFITEIENSLREELDSEELDFDQKMRLYKMITTQSIASQEGILSLFRPTPGAPSILAQNLSEKEEKRDNFEETFDRLSSKDLQKIDLLTRFLENFPEEEEGEE